MLDVLNAVVVVLTEVVINVALYVVVANVVEILVVGALVAK